MQKLIIYGDIHGCFDEFMALRGQIKPKYSDIEVCVGDVITKGKKSIEVLEFIVENGIKSVLGNHEDKLVRYMYHEKSSKLNSIILDEDEQDILQNLTPKMVDFLQNMPLFLRFGRVTVLHGGVMNRMKLDNLTKKDIQKILRMRYLDQRGNFVELGKEDESCSFWADVYGGGEGFVVYGHQHQKEVKISKYALGIDTGCVYGNVLSAVIFNGDEYEVLGAKLNPNKK